MDDFLLSSEEVDDDEIKYFHMGVFGRIYGHKKRPRTSPRSNQYETQIVYPNLIDRKMTDPRRRNPRNKFSRSFVDWFWLIFCLILFINFYLKIIHCGLKADGVPDLMTLVGRVFDEHPFCYLHQIYLVS